MKRILIVPAVVAVALAVAACGGGSGGAGTSSNSSTGDGQRPGRPQLTDSQISCLEQQGVTMPDRGNGGPPGGGGQLTDQQRQELQQRRDKMMAAFQKCGIEAPQFGGGYGRPQTGGSSQ